VIGAGPGVVNPMGPGCGLLIGEGAGWDPVIGAGPGVVNPMGPGGATGGVTDGTAT
jgi:hypothetical protein